MKTDEVRLMAYVDGELPPDQRHEVEEHIRASAEAAELVEMLKASRVDYRGAFDAQNLPPVPDSLTQKIEAMARAHAARPAAAHASMTMPCPHQPARRFARACVPFPHGSLLRAWRARFSAECSCAPDPC